MALWDEIWWKPKIIRWLDGWFPIYDQYYWFSYGLVDMDIAFTTCWRD